MPANRREFLAVVAGSALSCAATARPLGIPIGIQPFSVRNESAKDPEGTVRQLARMGFQSIEISIPFHGLDAAKVRALLKSAKMISPSGSFGSAQEPSDWARSIDTASTAVFEASTHFCECNSISHSLHHQKG